METDHYYKDLLISDFEQSMEMLRHYDSFHWDVTKFCFSQICIIIGACWYIREQVTDPDKQYFIIFNTKIPVIAILLIVSAMFTLLCIMAILRNRVYFCKVSHYVNEHRLNAINNNALGFKNQSEMWTSQIYPKKFDWLSTHMLSTYLLVICFLAFVWTSAFLFGGSLCCCSLIAIFCIFLIFVVSNVILKN